MRMTFVSVTSGGSGSLGEAHVNASLTKKVLHITKRKRKSNIQHYCKSDDFRAGFEVAEWGTLCHSAWLQISPARFKQVYSDSAVASIFDLTNVFVVNSLVRLCYCCHQHKHCCRDQSFHFGCLYLSWLQFDSKFEIIATKVLS